MQAGPKETFTAYLDSVKQTVSGMLDHQEITLEELLEIITWKQLGLYLNPIVILNVKNYFDPLLDMLRQAVDENFMRVQHGAIWHVAQTPQEAVELMYTTPLWDASIRKFAAI